MRHLSKVFGLCSVIRSTALLLLIACCLKPRLVTEGGSFQEWWPGCDAGFSRHMELKVRLWRHLVVCGIQHVLLLINHLNETIQQSGLHGLQQHPAHTKRLGKIVKLYLLGSKEVLASSIEVVMACRSSSRPSRVQRGEQEAVSRGQGR